MRIDVEIDLCNSPASRDPSYPQVEDCDIFENAQFGVEIAEGVSADVTSTSGCAYAPVHQSVYLTVVLMGVYMDVTTVLMGVRMDVTRFG